MEKPLCRFCKADASYQMIKGEFVYGGREDQHFWQCDQCQMIYLYPAMSEEEESKFYASEFEKFMNNRSGEDVDWSGPQKHCSINQREVDRRLPFLESYLKGKSSCLEVGCSSGFMLYPLREKGLDVYGIDPSGGFLDFVKDKGVPIYQTKEDFVKEHKVKLDMILHYYVLEHIRNPVSFVQSYMDMLADGGVMIFEVPCATDPLVELYKVPAFDRFYWSVAHHWYFNKESLMAALEKAGYEFELFPEQRYDVSNHMVWMNEGKPGGLDRYASIFGSELDEVYRKKLKEHWLCDTIIAVVKKQ